MSSTKTNDPIRLSDVFWLNDCLILLPSASLLIWVHITRKRLLLCIYGILIISIFLGYGFGNVFHSWPFALAHPRFGFTLSFHLSFGLPLLLLPPSFPYVMLSIKWSPKQTYSVCTLYMQGSYRHWHIHILPNSQKKFSFLNSISVIVHKYANSLVQKYLSMKQSEKGCGVSKSLTFYSYTQNAKVKQ